MTHKNNLSLIKIHASIDREHTINYILSILSFSFIERKLSFNLSTFTFSFIERKLSFNLSTFTFLFIERKLSFNPYYHFHLLRESYLLIHTIIFIY